MKGFLAIQSQLHGLSAADFVLAEKIVDYFPFDAPLEQQQQLFVLLLAVHQHLFKGNTCLPLDHIAGTTVFSNSEDIEKSPGIKMLAGEGLSSIVSAWLQQQSTTPPYVLEQNTFFIQRYYAYEKEIFVRLGELQNRYEVALTDKLKQTYQSLFKTGQTNKYQAIAAANALQQKFMILNGSPGTGKTYTVLRILLLLLSIEPDLNIRLAAPTGKAAQRLTESIQNSVQSLEGDSYLVDLLEKVPKQAETIHRLLGAQIGRLSMRYHEQHTLSCDLLLIDEFSMVDSAIFAKILRACKFDTRIILVGDAAQLPAIEAGDLMRDMSLNHQHRKSPQTASWISQLTGFELDIDPEQRYDHLVSLEDNQRSASNINTLAACVKSGDKATLIELLHKENETTSYQSQIADDEMDQESYQRLQNTIIDKYLQAYSEMIESSSSALEMLQKMKNHQLMTPLRKGPAGVEQINQYCCQYLNQKLNRKTQANVPDENFHGQAIIVVQNDAVTGLSNGDYGVLWRDEAGQSLIAYFERENGQVVKHNINRLPKYEFAFALTIHKTQGSEYQSASIILPFDYSPLCTQALLYTAITRAKKHVQVLAKHSVLAQCLNNEDKRHTYLSQLIQQK